MRQMDRWWPQLSRVTFPRYEMGRRAAELLTAWIDGGQAPASEKLAGEVVPGSTLQAV